MIALNILNKRDKFVNSLNTGQVEIFDYRSKECAVAFLKNLEVKWILLNYSVKYSGQFSSIN